MRSDLKPACLAAGLAMAWGAAASAPAASVVTLDATFTPSESLTNASFVYSSNTSSDVTSSVFASLDHNAIPLGNLTAGTPVSFSFTALDNGNHAQTGNYLFVSDSADFIVLGQNAGGGVSFNGNTSGPSFATLFPTLSESNLLAATADLNASVNVPAAKDTLYDALDAGRPHPSYAFGIGAYSATFVLVDFASDPNARSTSTPNSTITINGPSDTAVPLPASAFLSLPALATLALRRRRRHTAPA